MVYLSERGYLPGVPGHRHLIVRTMESGRESVLASDLSLMDTPPRWSPDGRFVLVVTAFPARGVYRLDTKSENLEPLLSELAEEMELSPDGGSLFYLAGGQINVRDLETGRVRELYGPSVSTFSLSPDGRWLALTENRRLSVLPASGGKPKALLRSDGGSLLVQAWMPDNRTLLFTREEDDGGRTLWRIPVTGGEPEEMDLEKDGLRSVRVHPDGKRIAFTAGEPRLELWVMENFLSDPYHPQ